MEEQVITLCAATHKKFMGIPKKDIKKFQMTMLERIRSSHPEIYQNLHEGKDLTEEITSQMLAAVDEVKATLIG